MLCCAMWLRSRSTVAVVVERDGSVHEVVQLLLLEQAVQILVSPKAFTSTRSSLSLGLFVDCGSGPRLA